MTKIKGRQGNERQNNHNLICNDDYCNNFTNYSFVESSYYCSGVRNFINWLGRRKGGKRMTRTALLEVGKQQADSWLIDNWQRIKAKQHIEIKKDFANGN
ncbi:hypothetical protein TEH_18430 [Tetragenococcus halophilus NBRC 12172]|uniref:Uncharacterized protein n=1 Tax=Tetragenococcus halophilus (strain DSM 20338 / JCM 20259 / NCIMB 9735 / NBRC 12172) TaxID=945021 RepID=A0AAN1SHM8_TETHN|nr:hypothetical protein TEH_18430 [Tetragenococcus halophilus NBRC 12172]